MLNYRSVFVRLQCSGPALRRSLPLTELQCDFNKLLEEVN